MAVHINVQGVPWSSCTCSYKHRHVHALLLRLSYPRERYRDEGMYRGGGVYGERDRDIGRDRDRGRDFSGARLSGITILNRLLLIFF
jgi:hypothetical protein